MNNLPEILALDFDGVICDGLAEYFTTTKQTYQKIWGFNDNPGLDDFREQFYRLRPVIEIGWEMPILVRALVLGINEKEILENWTEIVHEIIQKENLSSKNLAYTVDNIRDNWINNDLDNWLKLHDFYQGVSETMKQIMLKPIQVYIVSTKEGRFIKEILKQEEIELPENQIIGKESKRPKHETLRIILEENKTKPENMYFIEDRIEPLEIITQQPDLQTMKLYLAAWGYNTEKTRERAKQVPNIHLLTLEDFTSNFLTK